MRTEAETSAKRAAQDLQAERESRSNAEKGLMKLKAELESLQAESESSRRMADQQLSLLQSQIQEIKAKQDAARSAAAASSAAAPPSPPPPPPPATPVITSEAPVAAGDVTAKPKTRKAASKAVSPEGGSVKEIKATRTRKASATTASADSDVPVISKEN